MRAPSRYVLFILGSFLLASCAPEPAARHRPPTPRPPAKPGNPPVGLDVGETAPEITGVDLDGERFSLSDYRGKVVVLDFWGNWCPPCRGMYPHNRFLVKQFKDKPFAFLGVNSGNTVEELQALRKDGKITWRVWCDEPPNAIVNEWRIRGYPTIVVIDARGVIRARYHAGPPLDEELEEVVKELVDEVEHPPSS